MGRATTYNFEYDDADQLKGATLQDTNTPHAVKNRNFYGYDFGSNRTSEQNDNQTVTPATYTITKADYNGANQLTGKHSGGPMRFSGTLSEPASVTVGGKPAAASGTSFTGYADVAPGDNQVVISATNANGQTTSHTYGVTVAAGAGDQSFTYDANGNMTGDGTRIFGWDAENRLVKITKGTDVQEFVYNGVGQRVTEKSNTVVKQLIWDGTELCEERDASNTVTKRFYEQGEQIGGTNYFYTRDHLGSIREMTDSTGVVRARYDYDAYGRYCDSTGQPQQQRINLISANQVDADFGFTGHYWDTFAGVNLAYYRAYDPNFGRWLSRDPIEENGGINLYGYVENSPISFLDPLGLDDIPINFVYPPNSTPADYKGAQNQIKQLQKNLDRAGHGDRVVVDPNSKHTVVFQKPATSGRAGECPPGGPAHVDPLAGKNVLSHELGHMGGYRNSVNPAGVNKDDTKHSADPKNVMYPTDLPNQHVIFGNEVDQMWGDALHSLSR